MSDNRRKFNRFCEIHEEEPCGPNCSDACTSRTHRVKATTFINNGWMSGWVCGPCAQEIADAAAAECRERAKYDYACGYRD